MQGKVTAAVTFCSFSGSLLQAGVPQHWVFSLWGENNSRIIAETTVAIWSTLQPLFVPSPNEEKWKSNAERCLDLWNLPNCIGATDGKHIRVTCFPKSGSRVQGLYPRTNAGHGRTAYPVPCFPANGRERRNVSLLLCSSWSTLTESQFNPLTL
jgi:hypothetical protein